jgi:hypothetical protein
MIRLRQHVPAFVNDGQGGWSVQAATLAELLALPQVASYARDTEPVERKGTVWGVGKAGDRVTLEIIHPAPEERRFHQWSRSENRLMVEHNQGDYFWVVGTLSTDDPRELADLPVWRETENARKSREAWNAGDVYNERNGGKPPKRWRCAEHGVEDAKCCLK